MKGKKNWLYVLSVLLISAVYCPSVCAQEEKETEDRTLAPYFFVESPDPSVDQLPLKKTEVTTNINGMISETYVTQIYANEGECPVNASYVFPASTKVTIHGMTMKIGEQTVIAQIREREEAKQEFEQAKSEGKSSSLLEEQRPNVFTMDVANIMPGDVVEIELHYTEMILPAEGVYQFVFPTVVGPRYTGLEEEENTGNGEWMASPYFKEGSVSDGAYDIKVNLSVGIPITSLECSSHEVEVNWKENTGAQITLSDSKEFAGDRDFILDYKLAGDEINSGLMLYTGENENFFQLMVQPPERYQPEELPPREYIFVLDVSGSMNGYPLDTARELIRKLVTNLRREDSFNVILFSDIVSEMALESVEASDVNIECAMELIDQQEGGGGTELAAALEDALNAPVKEGVSRNVVIITDGYISDEEEIFDRINENLETASFFSFGIGTSVNRYLMEGIANVGMGETFVVTESSEAEEAAKRFRTYIEAPILTDIQVEFDGFSVYDVEPSKVSALFAQRPVVIFGKWKGEPSGEIQISGKTRNQNYTKEIQVSGSEPSEDNGAIRYLWARRRVEMLTDYGFGRDNENVKKEVTSIGLDYSMITPYTSFVAVLDTVRNPDGGGKDVEQPSPLPAGVSNLAVGGYQIGSEPSDVILILMLLTAWMILSGIRSGREKMREKGL